MLVICSLPSCIFLYWRFPGTKSGNKHNKTKYAIIGISVGQAFPYRCIPCWKPLSYSKPPQPHSTCKVASLNVQIWSILAMMILMTLVLLALCTSRATSVMSQPHLCLSRSTFTAQACTQHSDFKYEETTNVLTGVIHLQHVHLALQRSALFNKRHFYPSTAATFPGCGKFGKLRVAHREHTRLLVRMGRAVSMNISNTPSL